MNSELLHGSLEHIQHLPPPRVSFEFFPPKTEEMEKTLWETVKILEPYRPQFVSVTYGAGGSTRARTHSTVKRIKEETSLTPAAHLTCVKATKEEINAVAQTYLDIGVNHIVALRGDDPDGNVPYKPTPGGYAYAVDLVKGLRKLGNFEISVAGYPEGHPEAESLEKDLDHLKAKVDAGANRIITQYFFDTDSYLKFQDKVRARGIDIPIEPGILIISNFKQMLRFSKMCGASVPPWIHHMLDGLDEYPERRDILSALIAAEQCRILREEGINEFHFYTLNRPHITAAVCHMLGLRPAPI